MSISLELPLFKTSHSVSLLPYNATSSFSSGKKIKCKRKWKPPYYCSSNSSSSRIRVTMSENDESCPPSVCENENDSNNKCVQVIAIGSRKDALLDFCLDSPLNSSSSLQFWNIVTDGSPNVQLQQRFLGKNLTPRIVEAPSFIQTCSKAIILLASAGYGSDDAGAIDILKTAKSLDCFAIAIIIKPFSFEGQRRLDEVKDLAAKLQDHINFYIDIDTDRLLEKDSVTLDEALKTANNAVFLAVNAISTLLSDMHRKLIDIVHSNVKELKVSEIFKILGNYKEAKIGFGAGSNIKTSILQAIYDCPFIGAGVKELNGMVICVVATSNIIGNNDLQSFLHTFRQITEYTGETIVSFVHEPNLEPDLLVTTVVTLGLVEQASRKSSIFSRLAHHFPFVFNLLRRNHQQSNDTQGNSEFDNACVSEVIGPPGTSEIENKISDESVSEGFYNYSNDAPTLLTNYNNDASSGSGQSEAEFYESRTEPPNLYDQIAEGTPFQRELLNSWNLGPGYQIAQQWAKERSADSRASTMIDNLGIFCLPIGVRASEELDIFCSQQQEPKTENDVKEPPTGASFDVMRDFYSTAATLLKGKTADVRKKQGVLSTRAASMLEAERDSPKKWTPVVEIQYRGGIYRGRCQGGLPEGKGRLILEDGSIYEGMWRYGKRSGLGIFYFSNGDVFQGSWRDDMMHGKGWFYFHTGDRWFANFWKGKANGEGRFYSKFGDIFFGRFRDGWRHGDFLCIDVGGKRCIEIWDEGVLVSRKQLNSDSGTE
ncbi:protein ACCUMULATION AND REPLICATION OF CHLOROPLASTS 3, chloroplastic isoform X1 [Citrus sinensis]|nr:protein ACCUMULATION AND REPLICATION OF CHLOROPLASTS 3 isoform X1 [Citrus x clementina]XP_006470874.2 protein ACCUMULATION AND REPLICATION OF CHLOROPLASTS 3, chloroplastic isoform X1 [Citrus sinensis]